MRKHAPAASDRMRWPGGVRPGAVRVATLLAAVLVTPAVSTGQEQQVADAEPSREADSLRAELARLRTTVESQWDSIGAAAVRLDSIIAPELLADSLHRQGDDLRDELGQPRELGPEDETDALLARIRTLAVAVAALVERPPGATVPPFGARRDAGTPEQRIALVNRFLQRAQGADGAAARRLGSTLEGIGGWLDGSAGLSRPPIPDALAEVRESIRTATRLLDDRPSRNPRVPRQELRALDERFRAATDRIDALESRLDEAGPGGEDAQTAGKGPEAERGQEAAEGRTDDPDATSAADSARQARDSVRARPTEEQEPGGGDEATAASGEAGGQSPDDALSTGPWLRREFQLIGAALFAIGLMALLAYAISHFRRRPLGVAAGAAERPGRGPRAVRVPLTGRGRPDERGARDGRSAAGRSVGEEFEGDNVIHLPGGHLILTNVQHIGARQEQQDSFRYSMPGFPELTERVGLVAVVADGMGGLAHGANASKVAARSFVESFANRALDGAHVRDALWMAIEAANRAVHRLAVENGAAGEVGTTLSAVVIGDEGLHWIAAGDSRIYLSRRGQLSQVNVDHSAIRKAMLDPGIGFEGGRNVITSYLGLEEIPEVDQSQRSLPVLDGDRVLVCSDGSYEGLEDVEIQRFVERGPEVDVDGLADAVMGLGRPNQDNLTAVGVVYRGGLTSRGA